MAPDDHKINACKLAVKSTKYQVISSTTTMDEMCPLQLWSRFLLQMQGTLNIRTSQQDNKLTANEELNGPFDWNATPMAQLGNNMVALIAPDNRTTYAPHKEEAYATSMTLEHYELLEMCIPTTRGYRLTGTYRLFPSYWSVPTTP